MKILLIGHSIVDHIQGVIKPGGIFYTLTGMLGIKNSTDKFFLLTGLNSEFKKLFYNYEEANLDFSVTLNEMPEVFLQNFENREREEIYKNISTQLSLEKITGWNSFDGVLINMITGFDISIEQLNFIRKSFDGLIYFDIHTLSRGVDENMKRNFRPVPEIDKWLANIDVLQCNENELRTILDDEIDFAAEKILKSGPKMLIITKGSDGVTAFSKTGNMINKFYLPAEKVSVINKIGCGDIFGAVFFYSYLHSRNFNDSLSRANKAAGIMVANKFDDLPGALRNGIKFGT